MYFIPPLWHSVQFNSLIGLREYSKVECLYPLRNVPLGGHYGNFSRNFLADQIDFLGVAIPFQADYRQITRSFVSVITTTTTTTTTTNINNNKRNNNNPIY